MLFADGFLGLFLLGLWLFCIFDVITTPVHAVKHLPKLVWLLIVLILPDIGSVIWLIAGRDRSMLTTGRPKAQTAPAKYDRPGRAAVASPDDDEAFLRQLRERVDAQRRQHEQKRRALQAEDERLHRRPDQS